MLLNNKKGQTVSSEYVVGFFIVIAMATAMTFYFKRTIQGRVRDTRNFMVNMVSERAGGYFSDPIPKEYEPYYGKTESIVERQSGSKTELFEGDSTGLFKKTFNEQTSVQTKSETAPPGRAN